MNVSPIKVMGVLNVTPDSFSDGGEFTSVKAATIQAEKLIADGADILDIGGESTRPFADPVATVEELRRVIPVIKAIRKNSAITISIDTTKAEVAEKALDAGANIINDVSALRTDPKMIELVRATEVPVILMHMQGTPADMQIKPDYGSVVEEILAFFKERIALLAGQGIERNRIILDPGIGFGKSLGHNLSILKHLERFAATGQPILLAHSRKRFLGEITGLERASQRDFASAVVAALASSKNISMVRVHDVAATRQALGIAAAIEAAE